MPPSPVRARILARRSLALCASRWPIPHCQRTLVSSVCSTINQSVIASRDYGSIAGANPMAEMAEEEFCCLLEGYETRCGTCPYPKSLAQILLKRAQSTSRKNKRPRPQDQQQRHYRFGYSQSTSGGGGGSGRWAGEDRGGMQRVEALALLGFDNSHDGPLAFVGPSKLDIKRAFRERAVKLHPDVSHEDDIQSNTERFRELVDAYELLIATSR